MHYNFVIDAKAVAFLAPLYNSPQRKFHDINHVYFCISKLQEIVKYQMDSGLPIDFDDIIVLKYSIWFHDAIFSPYYQALKTNERQSVSLFESFNKDNQLISDSMAEKIKTCITSTENHLDNQFNATNLTKIMLDISLSSFAKPVLEVFRDSDKIFEEYSVLGLPKVAMLENRIHFLNTLLKKKRMFYTQYFYETYEDVAKRQLAMSIDLSEETLENYRKADILVKSWP